MSKQIGVQARLMSKALRKLIVLFFLLIKLEKKLVIYGNSEITTGGKALRFYSTIRLEVRKGEQLTRSNQIVGHKIKIKVVKNKVAHRLKQ